MAVTLHDVARRSGVSTGTVSRVLNNKMPIPLPPETIARVQQAAAELDYRPNVLARGLATGRMHTLGLYSTEMTDPHFAQMLEAVEAAAAERGYHLVVSSSFESIAHGGRTDGTVFLGAEGDPALDALPRRRPVVFVNRGEAPRPNHILWSDTEGAARATRHLIERGRRHLLALWCWGDRGTLHPKAAGFRRAADEGGVAWTECWECSSREPERFIAQFEDGYQAVTTRLAEGLVFDGIVARNDFLALGALRALREAGRRVPEDIAVVGYTDSIQARCADPPLTSVRTPIGEAGIRAVHALIQAIEQGETQACDGVLLPTTLTVRASSDPALPPRDAAPARKEVSR